MALFMLRSSSSKHGLSLSLSRSQSLCVCSRSRQPSRRRAGCVRFVRVFILGFAALGPCDPGCVAPDDGVRHLTRPARRGFVGLHERSSIAAKALCDVLSRRARAGPPRGSAAASTALRLT